MEIAKEIYQAHKQLSGCSETFLDFVRGHPDTLKRSNFDTLVHYNAHYLQTQPWPTFINEKTKAEIEEAAVKICNLIKSIPDRLFSYDFKKISYYYCIPEDIVEALFFGVDNDYIDNLLARADFVFSPSSGLKCLEYNIHANLGGWEMDILEPLYINTPILSTFLKENGIRLRKNNFFSILLTHLIDRALERFTGNNNHHEINTAVVLTEEHIKRGGANAATISYLESLYQAILQQKNNALRGNLVICRSDQLNLIDDSLFYSNKRIYVSVDLRGGRVPLLLMSVVKKGNLLLYNGPISEIMSNKLNLALLSEHEESDVFSSVERALIRKYVPWTRKVIPGDTTYRAERIKLEDFAIANREQLVLKPSRGLGGTYVYPGRMISPNEWKQIIDKALIENNWVVQEYIESLPYLYQVGENGCAAHHAVWGFFVFGSRYAGGFVRVLPEKDNKGVINSHYGAEESMILEVLE
jgi:hypothetical protein